VYVLALTSNPEGPEIQHATTADGRTVGQLIIDRAAGWNSGPGHGSVGIVVGATVTPSGVDFSRLNGSILAPGLGAQGATPGDLRTVFGAALSNVLPSMSREVMNAGPAPAALRGAARRALAEMEAVITVG
jgi:orotidine-5'-phosphate decarboxylase